MTNLRERLEFVRAFIRHPRAIGSVTPSSRHLAKALIRHIPPSSSCVVELGAGTGPITRALLDRLGPAAMVLAFEADARLCSLLRQISPDPRLIVVQDRAESLLSYVAEHGRIVTAVVSGLPFANFDPETRRVIATAAHRALADGGEFVGYSYGSPALRSTLREVFGNCGMSVVLRNIPPALVFRSLKQTRAPPHVGR